MTKVSRFKLEPHRQKLVLDRFWNAITALESKEETVLFLKDLLTPVEIQMIAKRISIGLMLAQGYNYQQITAYLKTTPDTVASVNRALNFGNNGFIAILQRLQKIEDEKQQKLEGMGEYKIRPTPLTDTAIAAAQVIGKQIKKHKKRSSITQSNTR